MPFLTVGIPKEIKACEKRVALTPAGIEFLSRHNINCLVEKNAGALAGFSDQEYEKSGAKISPSAEAVYKGADLIQKVKEPLPAERAFFHKNQIIFAFFHLASPENCDLVKALVQGCVTAIAYETVSVKGQNPILFPMSQIAGALAAGYAGLFMHLRFQEKGSVLFHPDLMKEMDAVANCYPEASKKWKTGKVVIWGAGAAGCKAADISLAMGGEITLIELNDQKRTALQAQYHKVGNRIRVLPPNDLKPKILEDADIFIGCVHRAGFRADLVVDDNQLAMASKEHKKVIVDVSVDQGGNFPQTKARSYENPLSLDSHGNTRFAVPNMPAFCGRAASQALDEATREYTLALAKDIRSAFQKYPELRAAVNVEAGEVIHPAIREAHKL